MFIEIRKAGFINKGAELMLYSIMQQLEEKIPDAKLVMAPGHETSSAPYIKRAKLGFYQKAWLWRFGLQFGDMLGFLPTKLREMYGIVLDSQIDVVLDAAGFSYSDQWGLANSMELARATKRWRKQGKKVVLLPQAFGPFDSEKSKEAVKIFVGNSDLVYAREEISYQHLVNIVGKLDKIRKCPDFTNLIEGVFSNEYKCFQGQVCLIPNYRMIDKTSQHIANAYPHFLERIARLVINKGKSVFLLVHEGHDDMQLAKNISSSIGGIQIVTEADPLKIKGLLGACRGVVGSRFHGLVSALSQGIPSLATGWSHKYKMLFSDYDFEEGVIDASLDDEKLEKALSIIVDDKKHAELSARLIVRAEELKMQSNSMWNEVFQLLRTKMQ